MSQPAAKRPVVLIVEDGFLLRMHTAEMIADAGYDIVEAENADWSLVLMRSERLPDPSARSVARCTFRDRPERTPQRDRLRRPLSLGGRRMQFDQRPL